MSRVEITFGICVSDVVDIGEVNVKYEFDDDVGIEAKLVAGT
jgi:hypothetical protein